MKHTDTAPLRSFDLIQGGKHEQIKSTKAIVLITNPTGKVLVTKVEDLMLLPGGYYNGNKSQLEQKIEKQVGHPVTLTHQTITHFKRSKILIFAGTIEKAKKGMRWIDPGNIPPQLSSLGARIIKNYKTQSRPILRAV